MGAACRLAAAVATPIALALLIVYYTVPAHAGGAARKPAAAVSGRMSPGVERGVIPSPGSGVLTDMPLRTERWRRWAPLPLRGRASAPSRVYPRAAGSSPQRNEGGEMRVISVDRYRPEKEEPLAVRTPDQRDVLAQPVGWLGTR